VGWECLGDGVNIWMGMVNTKRNHPKLFGRRVGGEKGDRREWVSVGWEYLGDGVNISMGMVNTKRNHPKLIEIATRDEFI
jgi:hypothetical protein